jgi:hypothetical protein
VNLLTSEERDDINSSLGYTQTADAPGVQRALTALRQADRHHTDRATVTRAIAGAMTVIKRLLHIEAEYSTVRATIARLEVANHRGDDYGLADLAFELQQAGVDLKNDYDHADDLARATEQEGLL